ncbi:hypothetical protein B0H66DRAFT_537489 [Apodospora peruviana]|uniref:Uncharacterized protein n=1 Tax=Apodospora peruviana TaxID=516989 RepID=A0AAE0HWV4_9PEZI|nr:hypothetical protein B0H66DRAFT_537489 [Apodospora peruviana]
MPEYSCGNILSKHLSEYGAWPPGQKDPRTAFPPLPASDLAQEQFLFQNSERFPPHTELLDLLPIRTAPKAKDYTAFYPDWQQFNKVQTQTICGKRKRTGAGPEPKIEAAAKFCTRERGDSASSWAKGDSGRAVYTAPIQNLVESASRTGQKRLAHLRGGKDDVADSLARQGEKGLTGFLKAVGYITLLKTHAALRGVLTNALTEAGSAPANNKDSVSEFMSEKGQSLGSHHQFGQDVTKCPPGPALRQSYSRTWRLDGLDDAHNDVFEGRPISLTPGLVVWPNTRCGSDPVPVGGEL